MDVVYTTRWQTTAAPHPGENWRRLFAPFALDSERMEALAAGANSVLLHDLPAVRGEAITADLLEEAHEASCGATILGVTFRGALGHTRARGGRSMRDGMTLKEPDLRRAIAVLGGKELTGSAAHALFEPSGGSSRLQETCEAARLLNVQLTPVSIDASDLSTLGRAIVCVPTRPGGAPRYLVICGAVGHRIPILRPDGGIERIRKGAVAPWCDGATHGCIRTPTEPGLRGPRRFEASARWASPCIRIHALVWLAVLVTIMK